MEEDWRLTRDDGFSQAELLEQQRVRGGKLVSWSPEPPPPGGGSVQPSAEACHIAALKEDWKKITERVSYQAQPGRQAKGKGKQGKQRQVQGWPLRTTKPSSEEFENATTFVKQLVRFVTAAHRNGRGDMVWMSWNGTDTRGKHPMPQHTSTLLAVSYDGTVRVKEKFWQDVHRSHFDVSLKWVCENYAKGAPSQLRVSNDWPLQHPQLRHLKRNENFGVGPMVCRRRARASAAHDVGEKGWSQGDHPTHP